MINTNCTNFSKIVIKIILKEKLIMDIERELTFSKYKYQFSLNFCSSLKGKLY